jgi:hypothetical protein
MSTEVRCTDALSGGQKGRKDEEYAYIPPRSLAELAKVYGYGAKKYAPRNMEKGYPWSWSFSAMMRHCWAFWRGENIDPESNCHHLAHCAWHCFTLMDYVMRGVGTDDRSKAEVKK